MKDSQKLPTTGAIYTPLLNRWNNDADAQSELFKILAHPRFEQALAVLQEMATPKGGERAGAYPETGDSVFAKKALDMARLEGYADCLTNLRILVTSSKVLGQLQHPGWQEKSPTEESSAKS